MPTEKPRYCITVDEEMLREIDDFRFGKRYNSRSQATLELIRMGLQVLREREAAKKADEGGEQQAAQAPNSPLPPPAGGETILPSGGVPMNVTGIIAEYNPFHNGHLLLARTARQAGADAVVAVMGGNWLQRGGPALFPKEVRTRAALRAGIDLVLELPLPYAAAPARHFAAAGVAALAALRCVDTLAFGSESGALPPLLQCARVLRDPRLDPALRRLMENGAPYAAARQQAVADLASPAVAEPLARPNDTLALQYLLELDALPGRPIRPFTIPRQGAGHQSSTPFRPAPGEDGLPTASATWLRARILSGNWDTAAPFLPPETLPLLQDAAQAGSLADPARLELPLLATLRRMSPRDFSRLPDLSEGLEHRLLSATREAPSLRSLLEIATTKRYPTARLRRILLAAYLSIPPEAPRTPLPYLRVLGMTPRGARVLSLARGRDLPLPLSHSLARLERQGSTAAAFAALEARAGDLYQLLLPVPAPCGIEYRLPLVKEEDH